MYISFSILAACLVAFPVAAQQKPAAKPASGTKLLEKFEDWQAVTFTEAGQTGCYAFTRAQSSSAKLTGRGEVLLTVTHRVTSRDSVSISAGFTYGANAAVAVTADTANFEFYTDKRSAFARDGRAAVAAFQKVRQIVARSPAPKGWVSDTFSLRGFTNAYAAINKACPAK